MGALMHAESAFNHMPYDIEQVTQYALNLAQQNRLFVARMEQEGKLIGFFAGRLDTFFFNRLTIASDFAFFVLPEWRGKTRDTVRSVQTFKNWARQRGATEVCVGISTNVEAERTGQMLTRLGFQHVGGTYKWRA